MSRELTDLIDAIRLIASTRHEYAAINCAWNKLYDAEVYLQKQLTALVSEEF